MGVSKNLYSIIFILLFLSSCIPTAKKSSRRNAGNVNTNKQAPTPPVYQFVDNFIESGTFLSTSIFNMSINLNSFKLKGTNIDSYIQQFPNNYRCLIINFPTVNPSNPTLLESLIVAARPVINYNAQTNQKEHYYLIEPSNLVLNTNHCPLASIVLPPEVTVKKNTATNICSTCSFTQLKSRPLYLTSSGGTIITQVQLSKIKIQVTKATVNPINNFCSDSTLCKGQGTDCCLAGQCVIDQSERPNINKTDPLYTQAIADIGINPAHIFNYPNYFYLCPSNVSKPPVISKPPVDNTATKRLIELENIYNCLNPTDGELSICSTIIKNASQTAPNNKYNTLKDDLNFKISYRGQLAMSSNSIVEVSHGGTVIYKEGDLATNIIINNLTTNDDLVTAEQLELIHPVNLNAINSDLIIKYKVNGSCIEINSQIARCDKYYIQGQGSSTSTKAPSVMDHSPSSNIFHLPLYADITKPIKVFVDDIIRFQGSSWNLRTSSPAYIEFIGTSLQIMDTQKVRISYYVNTLTNPNLMLSKKANLQLLQQKCNCVGNDCNLDPLKVNGRVVDYTCKYPVANVTNTPPELQKVFLSSKTVPIRYYDITGAYKKNPDINSQPQEGIPFEYIGGNLLKPNNITNYIGWHEIYGTLDPKKSDSPKPAKEVPVILNKTYDIYVDAGSFSSCFNCGNDYYSNISKIFPGNFLHKGAGYSPFDEKTVNPFLTKVNRSDDLNFGRSCFVPLTMIPWTHQKNLDPSLQRLNRLNAQHFLFANGYNKDWYGFDYGSVIGSFDGITWFSVGNKRRIKATSTKLFLAINSYFGDLMNDNGYTITVQDSLVNIGQVNLPKSDFNSDGALCQDFYTCKVDSDCASKLGWQYSCENVALINSSWPVTDSNGFEVPNTTSNVNLFTHFKAQAGGNFRCVYRDRGSVCSTDYSNLSNGTQSYSGSSDPGLNMCSSNTYCEKILNITPNSKFNDKISRYGKSIKFQNSSSIVTQNNANTFGKGARVLGRPLQYNGTSTAPLNIIQNLSSNKINSICIPGKNVFSANLASANSSPPFSSELGDQVNAIGMTANSIISSSLVSTCPTFDIAGNYLSKNPNYYNLSLFNSKLTDRASSENMSSKSIELLENMSNSQITKDFNFTQVTSASLEKNRCLRTPGSVCHTDFDCSPSFFTSSKVTNINSNDALNYPLLNRYEIQFWQEPMICSQENPIGTTGHDPALNRCCRESNVILTIGTNIKTNPIFSSLSPGTEISLSSNQRYSRHLTTKALRKNDPINFPELSVAQNDICGGTNLSCENITVVENQFNTFSETAARTCCSGHWIREFSQGNGKNHLWEPGKFQTIPVESFKCMNWDVDPRTSIPKQFECADPAIDCTIHRPTTIESNDLFNWLNTIELTGIPQMTVKEHTDGLDQRTNLTCRVNPANIQIAGTTEMPSTIKTNPIFEYDDASGQTYLSATDMTNFEANIKQVFSPDTLSCCTPVGNAVDATDPASMCCSGYKDANNICKLKDFTNLSIYFNRYVSSAAKAINKDLFDKRTGFIKDINIVKKLACDLQVCESNTIALGVSLAKLKVPGVTVSAAAAQTTLRFLDGTPAGDVNSDSLIKLYKQGLKWSNNYYCVPQGGGTSLPAESKTFSCQ